MRKCLLWLSLLGASVFTGRVARADEGLVPLSFPLEMAIVDPDSKKKLPPYIVMFEKGLDKDGNDVRGPVGRLEALRGESKLFPKSNEDPGLPVVLRGLRFHRQTSADGTVNRYEVELLGEFNSVKVPVSQEAMKKFLAGQIVTFSLQGEKNFGVYSYISTIQMELKVEGDALVILSIEGDFTFREGIFSYTSQTKKLTPPAGRSFLYRGERRELPVLPII